MKSVPGTVVGINTTRKNMVDTVRLTKDTNMAQLVSGNHVIIYVDQNMKEHVIWKSMVSMMVHDAASVVYQCEDWAMQLRMEPIT